MLDWLTQRMPSGASALRNSFACARLEVMLSSTKKNSFFVSRIAAISERISSSGRRVCVAPKTVWTAQKSHWK